MRIRFFRGGGASAVLLSACSVVSQVPEAPGGASGGKEALIEPTDYLAEQTENYYWVSKMITPPGPTSKGEAEFQKIGEGTKFWSKNYSKFRQPGSGDLKPGLDVYCHDDCSEGGADPTGSRSEFVYHRWQRIKITDTSDLYKNVVTVDNVTKVGTNEILVIQ